jgi:CTD small phosphatase-like protein 2
MVTMRRRSSETSLKVSVTNSEASFITQAVRRTRQSSVEEFRGTETGVKRTRAMMEVADAQLQEELQNQAALQKIGLETPVIKSSGKGVSLSSTTMSTDDSTGTSESLEKREVIAATSSMCDSQSSEVCISHEVVSCSACTTVMTAVDTLPNIPDEDDAVDEDLEFDPYSFIKMLPPLNKCVPVRNTFLLPRLTRHSHKKTLVLDLDETLVHSTLDGSAQHSDFVFPVSLGSITHTVSVRKRPHLHTFLARMARHFEIVVFTASQQIYAEQLLDIVDPNGEYIRHRIYRDSCVVWEGNYLKDLTVLGRDLAHTIIVDNSPQAFGFQLENGVPIKSWYDDEQDVELLRLVPFLEKLAHVDDVRPHLGDKYGLKDLVDSRPYPAYY